MMATTTSPGRAVTGDIRAPNHAERAKNTAKTGLQIIPDAHRKIGLMHSPIAVDVFLQHSRAKGTLETYY